MANSSIPPEQRPLLENSDGSRPSPVPEPPSTAKLLFILSGVYLGTFLFALDSTLIATLSGPISDSFNNMPLLGWLASTFFIAATVTQPLAGKLSDIYGRRLSLLVANGVFAVGNLVCAVARTEWMVLLGRTLSGLGGGGTGPLITVVMTDLVPLKRRGVWQGTANICFGIGSGLGGPVGGWIADTLGWRWAFAVQLPVSALAMVLIAWKVRIPVARTYDGTRQRFARIDGFGILLLSTALITLLLGLLAGGNRLPWVHPLVLTALPVSLIAFIAFGYVETRFAAEPILPLRLLRSRTVAAVCLANWFQPMARFGILFHLPLYLQVRGFSASAAGLCFIPESVAIAITSIGSGVIMQRTGRYYWLSCACSTLSVAALALIAALQLDTPFWLLFGYLFILGMGYSGMLTTSLIAMLAATDSEDAAVATSANYACRSAGQVLGIALASAVFRNVLRPKLRHAIRHEPKGGADLARQLESNLELVASLRSGLKERVQEAYAFALFASFLLLLGLQVSGSLATFFMREHKLHSTLSRKPSAESTRETTE